MQKGFIYVLSSAAMPGLLKVGFSTKVPTARAQELSTTGVPEPFVVLYYCLVSNVRSVEVVVHRSLQEYRYTPNREFFQISLQKAIAAIRKACSPEHEWSDCVVLRSEDGRVTNTEYLTRIRGIEIVSRKGIESEVVEMVEFCELVFEAGLAVFIVSLFYDSNSNVCSFKFESPIDQYGDLSRSILAIASKSISQFEWFGVIHSSNGAYV